MRETEMNKTTHTFVVHKPIACSVCLGYIKVNSTAYRCTCGKVYHPSCSARVKECPFCGETMGNKDVVSDSTFNNKIESNSSNETGVIPEIVDRELEYDIKDVFLISLDGLLIQSLAFETSVREETDEDIMTGMLTAVTDFIKDSFREEMGGLKTLQYGRMTIYIERGVTFFLVVIFKGEPPANLRRYMRDALIQIWEKYKHYVKAWDGTHDGLEGLEDLMMENLHLASTIDPKGDDEDHQPLKFTGDILTYEPAEGTMPNVVTTADLSSPQGCYHLYNMLLAKKGSNIRIDSHSPRTDVSKARKQIIMMYHPDRWQGDRDKATFFMQKVNVAWELLSQLEPIPRPPETEIEQKPDQVSSLKKPVIVSPKNRDTNNMSEPKISSTEESEAEEVGNFEEDSPNIYENGPYMESPSPPKTGYSTSQTGEICSICQTSIQPGSFKNTCQCGMMYHQGCADWRTYCPFCNSIIGNYASEKTQQGADSSFDPSLLQTRGSDVYQAPLEEESMNDKNGRRRAIGKRSMGMKKGIAIASIAVVSLLVLSGIIAILVSNTNHGGVGLTDTDGDGADDSDDAFPNDPAAKLDTDGDGAPDAWNPGLNQSHSTMRLHLDTFPDDPAASIDTDNDGCPDAWNAGKGSADSTSILPLYLDSFVHDPAASVDTDGDGFPDEWNAGMFQGDSTSGLHLDAFPEDPAASVDTDKDGWPDSWNSGKSEKDSTSGLYLDAFPNDISASVDTDDDGSPDEWNPGKDETASTIGLYLDAFPTDPAASIDTDGDGWPDKWNDGKSETDSTTGLRLDAFPDDLAASIDSDNDGSPDTWNLNKTEIDSTTGLHLDAFPDDPAASVDTDGDGFPDGWNKGMDAVNSTTGITHLDAFPTDPAASLDSDGDGYPDTWNKGKDDSDSTTGLTRLDDFPDDPAASLDTDNDGFPDSWNTGKSQSDSTNGLELDKFPNDKAAGVDSDNDGSPDEWINDMDEDDSTTGLYLDAFPTDSAASKDSDGDGFPDEWNTGKSESDSISEPRLRQDAFPLDPAASMDTDGDGFPNEWNTGKNAGDSTSSPTLRLDAFPTDPAASKDTDGDGYPDEWNPGKSQPDSTTGLELDEFKNEPSQWKDTDGDGFGDNSSGVNGDAFPNDPAASIDTDGDGWPDEWNSGKSQSDSTTGLYLDKFPTDLAASLDTDNDGYPDQWNSGKNEDDSTTGLTLDQFPENNKYYSVATMFEWKSISSGSFSMGSTSSSNEQPVHQVTISYSFQMGTYEVTQSQWEAVMGSNPSHWKSDNLPVETVSWNNCQSFITKLNQFDPDHVYRMPSEAEWEYCCRAGSTSKYCFGDDEGQLGNYAWYSSNSDGKTHFVGQKLPNAWDLYDMHGNVWEWCQDDWHDNYTGAPDNGDSWGDGSGSYRVVRGGGWYYYADSCRSALRGYYYPGGSSNDVGLRLVRLQASREAR